LAFSPENVFYYSAGGGESQAVFQKNSKKSANGHLYRKFAAKRAAFRLTNTLQHFIIFIDFGLRTMVFAIAAAIGFFILFRVHSVRTNARAQYRTLNG
jgi:hypothetical protein